jgi:aminoglycoside phosphotransferase (APT) family kinase protein
MLVGVQKLHADELYIDEALVRGLVAAQFPQWSELPLERVASSGTDNALYRLGGDMVVRLPRRLSGSASIDHEYEWTRQLRPYLPVAVPRPVAKGAPDDDYPARWAVYAWLPGANPVPGHGSEELAQDLARVLRAFAAIDVTGPPTRRGAPLATQDAAARGALEQLGGMIDVDAAAAAWDAALAAPVWEDESRWLHGDLLPGNLLVRDGRLTGLLDFSLVGVGDPACDLMPAWCVLPAERREAFRAELAVDDATWARGRGWALSMGLIALPYYKDTNPGFAAVARHAIREVLAETNIRS